MPAFFKFTGGRKYLPMSFEMIEKSKINLRLKKINEVYQILDEVGHGTFGKVYKAVNILTKEFVAIKKLESEQARIIQDGFQITALREIKLLRQLNHPNIIRIIELI